MMQFYFDDLCIIGITKENVKRLQEGKPIHLDLKQKATKIGIVYGDTKPEIVNEVCKAAGMEVPDWMMEEAERDPL